MSDPGAAQGAHPPHTKRTFWLSFCDGDLPKGQQFLGACIVDVTADDAALAALEIACRFHKAQADAEWIGAASRKAHAMECNPGGEMMSVDITDAPAENLALYERNRLYSRAEIDAIDAALAHAEGVPQP